MFARLNMFKPDSDSFFPKSLVKICPETTPNKFMPKDTKWNTGRITWEGIKKIRTEKNWNMRYDALKSKINEK